MNYREEVKTTKEFKQAYVDGLERLIASKQQGMAQKRAEYSKDIFSNPEIYRESFRQMLGWPLTDDCSGVPSVKKIKLSDEDGYTLYRMQFEIIDGLEMTGLFFELNGDEKRPLVIVQHGGRGTPEKVAEIYGDSSNYNQMARRMLSKGVHIFLPQLLLWSDWYDVPFDRRSIDARLNRIGSSITAIELYGLIRILNYFEIQSNVSSFGMIGLSYGGFYTLFLSAIEKRIKSAISCSFFNTRDRYPWKDWTWLGAAAKFDDAEIACLVYPRKLCIEIGTKDDIFDVTSGIQSIDRLKELCKDVGTDWLNCIVFEGAHEFHKDDAPLDALAEHLTAED